MGVHYEFEKSEGNTVLRSIIILMNTVFLTLSVVLITAGILVQGFGVKYQDVVEDSSTYKNSETMAIVFIIGGSFIFIVSVFSIGAAIRLRYNMAFANAFVHSVFLILEISVMVLVFIYSDRFEGYVEGNMKDSMGLYVGDVTIREAWDEIQFKLSCCGTSNASDWKPHMKSPQVIRRNFDDVFRRNRTRIYKNFLPTSCCKKRTRRSGRCALQDIDADGNPFFHTRGCFRHFFLYLEVEVQLVGIVGLAVVFVEMLNVFLAWCLTSSLEGYYLKEFFYN